MKTIVVICSLVLLVTVGLAAENVVGDEPVKVELGGTNPFDKPNPQSFRGEPPDFQYVLAIDHDGGDRPALYWPTLNPGSITAPSTPTGKEYVKRIWSVASAMPEGQVMAWVRGEREKVYITKFGEIHSYYLGEDGVWRHSVSHLPPEDPMRYGRILLLGVILVLGTSFALHMRKTFRQRNLQSN